MPGLGRERLDRRFSPTFARAHLPALRRYLDRLPGDLFFVVEPRHADFFDKAEGERALDDLLRERGIARGVFDTAALFAIAEGAAPDVREAQQRKPRFAARVTRTAGHAFVRFVGQPEIAANDPWLLPWAERVAGWLEAGDDVYFFAHLPDDTDGPELARRFHAQVSERTPLPPFGGESADDSSQLQPFQRISGPQVFDPDQAVSRADR